MGWKQTKLWMRSRQRAVAGMKNALRLREGHKMLKEMEADERADVLRFCDVGICTNISSP